MTTNSNSAVRAKTGDRFTAPDGGTWVLSSGFDADRPWRRVEHGGVGVGWRSQEEAEAAGLVRLIPAVGWHYDEHGEDVVPDVEVDDASATDAGRAKEAKLFLKHWAGGKRVSPEDREDFISAWTGWHRGMDFDRECAERDAKAAIDAYVSALAVERAELTAALADARSAAPAPLDPGNPEHLRQVAGIVHAVKDVVGTHDAQAVLLDAGNILHRQADRQEVVLDQAAQDAAEAAKLAAVLSDFAIYDTDGSRDDAILAGHLVRRGVRVIEERAS